MEGNPVKVALKVGETTHLTRLDVNRSVEEILREICEANGINYERGMFALKVQDFCKTVGTEYVTEENKNELRHGRQLQLSKSPTERAATLIDRLHKSNDAESSVENLESLENACGDSVMLEELHRQNILQHLRVYASVRNPTECEYYRMYKIMGRFLAKGYVKALCEDEVRHLMDTITCEKKTTREMLALAFEILILLRKRGKLHWPTELLRKLTPYVRLCGEAKLQEKSLQFINYLYMQANDADERRTVFHFMKSSIMITYINKYVIREGLSEPVKHQLYLYQKIIMRKYRKQLEAVDLEEDKILENFHYIMSNIGLVNQVREMRASTEPPENEGLGERESKSDKAHRILRSLRLSLTPAGRRSAGSAPDAPGTEHKAFTDGPRSTETDHENEFLLNKIQRRGRLTRGFSVESVAADFDEDDLECGVACGQCVAQREPEWKSSFVPVLARDNLYYLILNDYRGFEKLLHIHDNQMKSVLRTSIGICGLLCRIFEICERETKVKRGTFIPLCFLYYDYIIEKIFCTAIKLYHHSRQEMGVAIDSVRDDAAVLKMVEDQLTMALESEPLEFLQLESRLNKLTVEEVTRRREKMVKEELERQLTKEAAFVQLREILMPRIMKMIREKRIRFMENGEHVHQFDYKGQKIPGKKWFLHVSRVEGKMLIEECGREACTRHHKPIKSVTISEIKQVEYGKKSNFHKEVYYNLYNERDVFFRPGVKQQEPELKYPISLKLETFVFVDFCAGSQATMDYWVDGLRLLIGETMKSKRMEEEVDYLMDVEMMVHVAGIEGIPIPEKAPPLPPLPPNYRFADI